MWLSAMTRPGITNAVRAVARHAHASTARLCKEVVQILSYLNTTKVKTGI